MSGKICGTDFFNWAVIHADDGRVYTALPRAADPEVFKSLRRNCRVEFDVPQVDGREVVRNLRRADPTVATLPRKLKAG
jgi:hypothetical protein